MYERTPVDPEFKRDYNTYKYYDETTIPAESEQRARELATEILLNAASSGSYIAKDAITGDEVNPIVYKRYDGTFAAKVFMQRELSLGKDVPKY